MTLINLQKRIDTARSAVDLFGHNFQRGYDRWTDLCRRNDGGQDDSAWADRLFHGLNQWRSRAEANFRHVESEKRSYTLTHEIGRGDLCEVSHAISDGEEFVLKSIRTAFDQRALRNEADVLDELTNQNGDDFYRVYYPEWTESFSVDGRANNVFYWRDGYFTAEEIRRRYPLGLDGRHIAWMFKRTLEAIGFVHNCGWLHGAVLPMHLMFHAENHGLQLVDWIHAARLHTPLETVPTRYLDWYPPEGPLRKPVTPSVDIYLAAKSMIFLAGGDPVAEKMPSTIPVPMRLFFEGCLLESPRMRPQDAWELHEEFTLLLEDLYGPPAFHRLDMPTVVGDPLS